MMPNDLTSGHTKTRNVTSLVLVLLPLMMFLLASLQIILASPSDKWDENIRPILVTDYLKDKNAGFIRRFSGDKSNANFFKILGNDEKSLLIGARNVIYNVSLPSLEENIDQRITWNPKSDDKALCLLKGKQENDCQNYIRVLVKIKDEDITKMEEHFFEKDFSSQTHNQKSKKEEKFTRLFICGTNAYNPKCRYYKILDTINKDGNKRKETSLIFEKEVSGKGFCPYDPKHNSTFIYADGELYSGTVADFSSLDALIIKNRLRTEQYDLKHLNEPDFVHSIDHEDYVYFFFRESAVEYINCGKSIFSRVGRICKNDPGFRNSWTTFLKARLNCSVPGNHPFYFNEVQSISNVIKKDNENLIYAVFTTPENSISGSAICVFSFHDINQIFETSPFKDQATVNANWLPMDKGKTPSPRPGMCSSTKNKRYTIIHSNQSSSEYSNSIPNNFESRHNFIKHHALMDENVPSYLNNQIPLYIKTSLSERLTVIKVDSNVLTMPKNQTSDVYDVLFVGTTTGRILKFISSFVKSPSISPFKSFLNEEERAKDNFPSLTLIESIQLFKFDIPIRNIILHHNTSQLVVQSDNEVVAVDMSRCKNASHIRSCHECIALQDPYCSWSITKQKCLYGIDMTNVNKEKDENNGNNDDTDTYVQDVRSGSQTVCPIRKDEKIDKIEVNEKKGTFSRNTSQIDEIGKSKTTIENINEARNESGIDLSRPLKNSNDTSDAEVQKANTTCASCECPCDLPNNLGYEESSKIKLNKTDDIENRPKSNEGSTSLLTGQSDDKDDAVTKHKYKVEEIASDINDESKNLIQTGIVIDISSMKEKGLENADKHFGMFDIPPNSLEPMKRQEKELKMFYDSVGRPSDAGTVEEVIQVFDDSSGSSEVRPKSTPNVALYTEETLAAANIVTAISALVVGILLGVLISKRCLNSNNFCNGTNSENSNRPSNKDHNCQFYISSSKYTTNDDNLSELEVNISTDRDSSANPKKSQTNIQQTRDAMSPYFIAQSIVLPESRAIQTTSNQVEKRYQKSSHHSNSSSAISNTTSFSDVSLYDQHIQCSQNSSEENIISTSFQSKKLNSQIENVNVSSVVSIKEGVSNSKSNEYVTPGINGSIVPHSSTTKSISNQLMNYDNDSSHSLTPNHGTHHKIPEIEESQSKKTNSQIKKKNTSKSSKESSISNLPSSSFWEQKVKRMYM